MLVGKTSLDYTNLFSPKGYKKKGKIIYNYFKDRYGKKKHRLGKDKKIDEKKKFILDVIKHNKMMKKNHKKMCRTLNYFEHLLLFFSASAGSASIFRICVFNRYSYRHCKFCNNKKNLCKNCKN